MHASFFGNNLLHIFAIQQCIYLICVIAKPFLMHALHGNRLPIQCHSIPLRVYPLAFAKRVTTMFNDLRVCGVGKPEVEARYRGEGAYVFQNTPWSDWPEAKLFTVLRYLRGNKNLCCPEYLKAVFPEPFEILQRMETADRPAWA